MSAQTHIEKTNTTVSMPRIFMHIEGLALLAISLVIYASMDFKWGLFALLLFAPDLTLALYPVNQRAASIAYNLAHTIVFPLLLAALSYFNDSSMGIQLSLIWLAHIGMDHVFGYGFKYLGEMKETHFSRV